MCAKYFLQINLFEEIIAELAIYYVDMKNIQHSGLTGLCNKCNTVKCAYNYQTQPPNWLEIGNNFVYIYWTLS